MTPGGPFQPLPFCDSVKSRHRDQVSPAFLPEETGSCFVRSTSWRKISLWGSGQSICDYCRRQLTNARLAESLLLPFLRLCLSEVWGSQKIKQKQRSCRMLLPKLQLFQTFQSWFRWWKRETLQDPFIDLPALDSWRLFQFQACSGFVFSLL